MRHTDIDVAFCCQIAENRSTAGVDDGCVGGRHNVQNTLLLILKCEYLNLVSLSKSQTILGLEIWMSGRVSGQIRTKYV